MLFLGLFSAIFRQKKERVLFLGLFLGKKEARAIFSAILILEDIKIAEVSNFDILDPLLRALLKKTKALQLPLQIAHKNSGGGRSGPG